MSRKNNYVCRIILQLRNKINMEIKIFKEVRRYSENIYCKALSMKGGHDYD